MRTNKRASFCLKFFQEVAALARHCIAQSINSFVQTLNLRQDSIIARHHRSLKLFRKVLMYINVLSLNFEV